MMLLGGIAGVHRAARHRDGQSRRRLPDGLVGGGGARGLLGAEQQHRCLTSTHSYYVEPSQGRPYNMEKPTNARQNMHCLRTEPNRYRHVTHT